MLSKIKQKRHVFLFYFLFYFRYKEECHTIASQSETKIKELKQKIDNLRERNEKLQSEIADVKRKESEVCLIIKKIFSFKIFYLDGSNTCKEYKSYESIRRSFT